MNLSNIFGGIIMNMNYIIGTLFFLTGSLMFYLHKLFSASVHILGDFVNEETITLNRSFDVISILFILIGIVMVFFTYITKRKAN